MAPNAIKIVREFFAKSSAFTLKRSHSLNIGEPYNFKHVMHVGMDFQNMTVNNGDYEQFLDSIKIE